MSLTQRLISVHAQCGIPDQNEIVFNIHFQNNSTGLVWDVSYRFSQLATLDQDINMNSDSMKEIPFPQIDEVVMNRLTSKKSYTGKLKELNGFRNLVETWLQHLIARCHLMPYVLYELVEDWFCLPLGPVPDWKPGRLLSQSEQAYLTQSRQVGNVLMQSIIPMPNTEPVTLTPAKKSSVISFLGFGGSKEKEEQETKANSIKEKDMEENFLLKVRVQRGQKGRNGKIEYDVCKVTCMYKSLLYLYYLYL